MKNKANTPKTLRNSPVAKLAMQIQRRIWRRWGQTKYYRHTQGRDLPTPEKYEFCEICASRADLERVIRKVLNEQKIYETKVKLIF